MFLSFPKITLQIYVFSKKIKELYKKIFYRTRSYLLKSFGEELIRRRFDAVALFGPMIWPSRAANPNMLFLANEIAPLFL